MKRERRNFGLLWIPLCVFAALVPGIVLPETGEVVEATLEGEISVNERDDEGNILSIYISDGEYGDCLIAKGKHWQALADQVGEMVRATGMVSETEESGFWYVIDVSRFSIVAGEPEYYEPEPEEPESPPDRE